jgi:hypothetical protein
VRRFDRGMPALSRRRSKDDPLRETWFIYLADVRVGVIGRRAGVPNSAPQWGWSCGFYPGTDPGEHRSGIAETFDEARTSFQSAWQQLAATRTEAPVQDGRIHIEKINAPFMYQHRGSGPEFGAAIKMAVERGWLELHESGTYVRLLKAEVAN